VVNKFAPSEIAIILRVLNLKGNDLADATKFCQLTPSLPQGVFDYEIELKNRNHALLTV